MTPAAAPATADEFHRRQLVLAAVSGAVCLAVSGVVALLLALLPDARTAPVTPPSARTGGPPSVLVAVLVAGTAAMAVLSLFLVRHALRVARFILRREAP